MAAMATFKYHMQMTPSRAYHPQDLELDQLHLAPLRDEEETSRLVRLEY
jgi:hypothetical protein